MNNVIAEVMPIRIPTYAEPPREEMPMFAENRVHQRTSGRPYPNKVVMKVDRVHREEKEYQAVHMENEYLDILILPEIGGRIFAAKDKTTDYDFFYRQHVIKPALIGVLGSWISGGVEFNWPFHHRASGFMPVDYTIEHLEDGSAVCWLSEHEPIDRMKGMVGIVLRPGCAYLETRMKLYNRTSSAHSFLWWENAAVPVNEQYQIFFPPDVSHVNFHYLKSRISYPMAGNGVYNGIPMKEARDISMHKNTREATSYFSAASEYDFFGGYDHGRECGVVHIGDHHFSPGKKMFTWGYNQLSRSWERALTDTDGQYAELMAGSYSDNQPNFSWLDAYETKQFSQFWYPISRLGIPSFANLNAAIHVEHTDKGLLVRIQPTCAYASARISIRAAGQPGTETVLSADLTPEVPYTAEIPGFTGKACVRLEAAGRVLAVFEEKTYDPYQMPETISDMPAASGMKSADDLYLAGLHVDQYRDPAVEPDAYWKEALKRDPEHAPSLLAMARYEFLHDRFESARDYAEKAIRRLSLFNERHPSGAAYYQYAQILEALGEYGRAEDAYYKASWAADAVGKAMTRIAMLDIRKHDYDAALRHADTALEYGSRSGLSAACRVIALRAAGREEEAQQQIRAQLHFDPMDHMMRFLAGKEDLLSAMHSSPFQTCLDLVSDLDCMGQFEAILGLLERLRGYAGEQPCKMLFYALAYYRRLLGKDPREAYDEAKKAPLGNTYPIRPLEARILEEAIRHSDDHEARFLLGCLLYHKRQYRKALDLWEEAGDDYLVLRCKAVACHSHFGRSAEALTLMKEVLSRRPQDEQVLYETLVLMDKTGAAPAEKIALLKSHPFTRDDLFTELAKAYNQNGEAKAAEETLLNHTFTPCEGGEHAIADQYIAAHLRMGLEAYTAGRYEEALASYRSGCVLPENLGAGVWNHTKLVPLRFREALCLEKLGRREEAVSIFRYIADITVEYFSNMHLKELPYYQVQALRALGEDIAAVNLVTRYSREWEKIRTGTDNGFFGTTPFFISFMDDPARLRRAQYLYLTGLMQACRGEKAEAAARLEESAALNNENLFAILMREYEIHP